MKNQRQAYAYAALAVLLWATVASAFKISLRVLDFLQLLCYACAVSAIALFVVLLLQRKLGMLRRCTSRDYLHSALHGFLNPFLYYVVLFKAYSLLPAQEAQPLNYMWPIMLVLLSIPLLREKVTFTGLLAICISFSGVLVISTRGDVLGLGFTDLRGAALALGSAVIWALFWIFSIRDGRDEVVKLFLNFATGFVFVLVATVYFSEVEIPDIAGFLGSAYVGLFEMGITFVVWSRALRLSETTARVSNLIYLAPFLSLVIIHFLVGEKIVYSTVVGLTLIVTGIAVQQYNGRDGWRGTPSV